METMGYFDVITWTKYHIKWRPSVDFGESLHFISETNSRFLVYPYNLSLAQILQENYVPRDKVQALLSLLRIINKS